MSLSNLTLMNGTCHGQQLAPLITSHNVINPAGDSTSADVPRKITTLPSMPYAANENHLSITSDNGEGNSGETVAEEEAPCIDIIINNVVCSFSTKCYLNLKKIATDGLHVEYRRENGMLNMKLRRPNVTATIWSSGNITCTGSTSEDEARMSARRIARRLQRLGFKARFTNYRVVNVLGTCSLNFGIKLAEFSMEHRQTASYEPELHPGVTYKIKEPKATLKIFSTGSITVTAPCVSNVQSAIEHIYPLVAPHKMDVPHLGRKDRLAQKKALKKQGVFISLPFSEEEDDEEDDIDEDEEDENYDLGGIDDEDDLSDFDSDVSHD